MSLLSRLFGAPDPNALDPETFLSRRAPSDPVLDVRTDDEFSGGHLRGAILADVNAAGFDYRIDELIEAGELSPDRPVYLYCRSGQRSGRATAMLRARGFDEAWNVGGFEALRAAGVEVEG